MTSRFHEKIGLITGAGGDLGAATARRMVAEGMNRVALFDREESLLEETAASCKELGATEVLTAAVDQADREAVVEGVSSVVARFGGIDVLFANAGYGQFAPFLAVSPRAWRKHVDVNLNGTFYVCQEVGRAMAERGRGGAIVVNASSGAVQFADQLSAYCATKSALRMLATGMAAELGIYDIRVNTIMPGVIETGMTKPMLADERHRESILADTPVGRLGDPEDVARLVCFLASEDAGFITGESVLVDGGQVIHGTPRWFRLDYRNRHDDTWKVGS